MSGRRLATEALSVGLFLALSGCAVFSHGPKRVEPALLNLSDPDLAMAVLYVDDQDMGHIPATIRFTQRGDFRVAFAIDRLGEKIYLFRNAKEDALITIDMIAGQPAAVDESTGVWTPLEFMSGGWIDESRPPGDDEELGPPIEEPSPAQPSDQSDPYAAQVQLPLMVRFINGEVLEASRVESAGRGKCRVVGVDGFEVIVDSFAIFTVESRTGQSFTSIIVEHGGRAP